MFQMLCDAWVDNEPIDIFVSFITGGKWILLGIVAAFVILVVVILVRAVKREIKENKEKEEQKMNH